LRSEDGGLESRFGCVLNDDEDDDDDDDEEDALLCAVEAATW